MPTTTELINQGLRAIGAARISDIETEDSRNANACRDVYLRVREQLQREHRWGFNRKYVQLGRLTTTPPFKWAYAYQLPADLIRLYSLHPDSRAASPLYYERVAGDQIYTDADEVYCIYGYREVDPNRWDELFQKAYAYGVVLECVDEIAASEQKVIRVSNQFEGILAKARSVDADEERSKELPHGSWVVGRRGRFPPTEGGEPPD